MNFFKFGRRKTDDRKAGSSTQSEAAAASSGAPVLSSSLNNSSTLSTADAAFVADFAVQELALPALIEFCASFQRALSESVDSVRSRLAMVKKVKAMSAELVRQTCTLTPQSIAAQLDQGGATAMTAFLVALLQEPDAVRGRHGLALHHFCAEMEQELEDDVFAAGTGFLSGLGEMNANLAGGAAATTALGGDSSSAAGAPAAALLEREPELDLEAIYHKLLRDDDDDYLPTPREVNEIVLRVTDVLRAEANLVLVPLPCTVVGDVHGQMHDLRRHVLSIGGPLVPPSRPAADAQTYLFLGDYVDRGPNSLQCVCLLFVAKLLAPRSVFLLRGNHECDGTNRHYGFLEECHRRYPLSGGKVGQSAAAVQSTDESTTTAHTNGSPGPEADLDWDMSDHPLWLAANEAFRHLPLCAVLYEPPVDATAATPPWPCIVAMHGGLSPYIENSLDGILAVHRGRSIEGGALADLTWSDPMVGEEAHYSSPKLHTRSPSQTAVRDGAKETEGDGEAVTVVPGPEMDFAATPRCTGPPGGFTFNTRGVGHLFGEDVTCAFLRANKLRFIVRAHQCVREGYYWTHQNRVLTLFSATDYCGMGNKGAVLRLSAAGRPEIVQYSASSSTTPSTQDEAVPHAPVPPPEFT